jgi:hypothetical protein
MVGTPSAALITSHSWPARKKDKSKLVGYWPRVWGDCRVCLSALLSRIIFFSVGGSVLFSGSPLTSASLQSLIPAPLASLLPLQSLPWSIPASSPLLEPWPIGHLRHTRAAGSRSLGPCPGRADELDGRHCSLPPPSPISLVHAHDRIRSRCTRTDAVQRGRPPPRLEPPEQ